MTIRILLLKTALLLSLFSYCALEVGNPKPKPPKANISLVIQGTKPGTLDTKSSIKSTTGFEIPVSDFTGTETGTLTLTTALISIKEIEFEMAGENDNEIDFEGPYIVDLISDTVSPQLPDTKLVSGLYESIKMALDKVEADDLDEQDTKSKLKQKAHTKVSASSPLFGNSIYIEGTYNGEVLDEGGSPTAGSHPFQMSFELDEEFELAGGTERGIQITEDNLTSVIIAFRLVKWFTLTDSETNESALDFGDLYLNSAGELVLNKDADQENNKEMQEILKENIKDSADYGEDKDDDGQLGSDEDDDPDEEDGDDD